VVKNRPAQKATAVVKNRRHRQKLRQEILLPQTHHPLDSVVWELTMQQHPVTVVSGAGPLSGYPSTNEKEAAVAKSPSTDPVSEEHV
jgi:hypothetical protein